MKTLFTSAATVIRTLTAFIYTIEKQSILSLSRLFFFLTDICCLTHSHTMTPFENTVGKGEIARKE